MSIPTILELIALVFAVVDLVQVQAKSLLGWAVVLVCIALLWVHLG
jgi:hypothetical protein